MSSSALTGTSFIGYQRGVTDTVCGHAIDPATDSPLDPPIYQASDAEVEKALALAEQAFHQYKNTSGEQRAAFLEAIAANVEASVDAIAERGPLETGLPEPRMRGESGRVIGQLRMFAALVRDGSWVDARIETAQPDRAPVPKPDIRSMYRPIGPVAVFAASNFPLAFSVAGGDTASALAAGCPVIVKAHSSHPGLSELVAQCIVDAAQSTSMPEGVFSMLHGPGRSLGQSLVQADAIQAVGFTGSFQAGRALMDTAAQRKQPIPVYAEMSSINPVIILPSALGESSTALAASAYTSLTMGVGQFCTNPGLMFIPESGSQDFVKELGRLAQEGSGATMLNTGICQSYREGVNHLSEQVGVQTIAKTDAEGTGQAAPAVFQTSLETFQANADLAEEVFGPATLLVTYRDTDQLARALQPLEGQLTISIHCPEEDSDSALPLVAVAEQKSGRVIFNGFGTGVEVCSSMVHGGPFPATSDGRSTSVGTMAIYRFARAVSYQDFPQQALPVELRD